MAYYQIPKYKKIEEDILKKIKSGQLKPGDKVDSESVLKEKYNVSAITVRKAFSELISDGVLVGVQGSGTFVAKKQMIRGLTSISFSDELKEQGYKTKAEVNFIKTVVDERVAKHLGVDPDQELICISRTRYADDQPVAYHISWLSQEFISVQQMQKIYQKNSLYKTLEYFNIFPTWVNENYSVRSVVDSEICKAMKVKKNYPSFFVKRTTFDDSNNIVEYAETYFNKDFYSVTVNIKA